MDNMNLADATITQLLIPVDDFERGLAFYRDVLGLPLLFAAPPQMAFFQCGTVRVLVGVTPAGQRVQRGSQIYFGVKDIQSVHSALSTQGVQFKAPPHVVNRSATAEVWLAEFVDPDGNQLALMSETPLRDV
jgi:predicted enzyme related to lactoylglutathione lyase